MRFSSWHVYQKDGNWYVAGKYTDAGGTWRRKAHRLHARNKTEARRMGQDWVTEQERSDEARESVTTLAAYADRLNAEIAASRALEPSSLASRETSLRHVREQFGDVPISSVTHFSAQAWINSMSESGLSASTVKKAYLVASETCEVAVQRGDLPINPFRGVRVPKVVSKLPNSLDARQRRRLVGYMEGSGESRLTVAAMLALYGGMRQGEVCGLRWGDVDLEGGRLWVRRSIGNGKGGAYVKEPKAGKVRDVPLGDTLTGHLNAWLVTYKMECADMGVRFDPVRLYVVGTIDGRFQNPSVLSREWRAAAKMMNLVGSEGRRCTFHDLRHTFATAAIAAGVDVKTVSSIMGHANAAMTLNIYASADPEAKRNAAPAIDRAVMARG